TQSLFASSPGQATPPGGNNNTSTPGNSNTNLGQPPPRGGSQPPRGGGLNSGGGGLTTSGTFTAGTAPGQAIGNAFAGGGGIAGVASDSDKESVKVYNNRQKYNEWDFIAPPLAPGQAPGGG